MTWSETLIQVATTGVVLVDAHHAGATLACLFDERDRVGVA